MQRRFLILPIYVFVLCLGMAAAFAGLFARPPHAVAATQATVFFVNRNAAGTGTGLSWTDAFTNVKAALSAAQAGDEVWVAAGLYTVGITHTDSLELKNGVALYGGFAGSETTKEQRNWQSHVTVISGDLEGNDIVDANGIVTDTDHIVGDNNFLLFEADGLDASTIVDGFVVTGGKGGFGGGMSNSKSSPTLIRLIFSGNRAGFGAGIYNSQSSPSLTDVTFRGNYGNFGGGIANNDKSNPILERVVFENNRGAFGGGVYNNDSSPVLTQVTFAGNTASFGAGMNNTNASHPVLTHVRFLGNSAGASGGGMNNGDFSSLRITNALFSGNRAGSSGGGMENSDVTFITATNTIFSGNRAGSTGGGMRNSRTSLLLQNSILWNNRDSSSSSVSESLDNVESTVTVRQSLAERCKPGGAWQSACGSDGGNNLTDADPLFIGPVNPVDAPTTEGNLRVWAGSPVINAGNNGFIAGVATDLDGNPRIVGGAVDLGAYEASANPPVPKVVYLPALWK